MAPLPQKTSFFGDPLFFKKCSGALLFSRVVSNKVPSAVQGLTVVFGMGTGVSPARIDTKTFLRVLELRTAMQSLLCLFFP